MKPSQRGGFIVGLVVGLLIGLAVALAVALYVTKAPIPFVNKVPLRSADQDAAEAERNRNWDPNAPLAGKNPARAAPAASGVVPGSPPAAAPAPAAAPPDAVAVPAAPVSRPRAAASAAETGRSGRDPAALLAGQPAPGTAPALPAARSGSAPATIAFYVQAGAYARPDDADAQRAKLALLGLSARITEREQAGRTVYRVRLGPFDSRSEAEDAQLKLAAGGVEANLVRVER